MITKKCVYPCCQEMAVPHHNYCEKHLQESQERRAQYQAYHSARRYNEKLYNSSTWRRLRKQVLEASPYCRRCGTPGEEGNPLTVDHIIPPKGDEELFYNIDNCQVLCRNCHNIKTNYETREERENNSGRKK